ncbi:MAG: hypothetical protein ACTHNZ_21935 [Trinickia sp.]|uniref:hypothetical protein n=1 Tax=Trinickia sp. TaxID=2571163 RepID=UPI003F7E450B
MISHAAQGSFERIFFQAARTRLTVDAAHACEIAPVPAHTQGTDRVGPSAEVLVLTIASIDFRIVMLLQFADDDGTRAYYGAESADRTLHDAAMEIGNLCCGAVNQQLVEHFPDLGMSTPYALPSDCMGYLDALKPSYIAAYDITIEHAARLRATLCVCASATVDFIAQAADVHESAGELELF